MSQVAARGLARRNKARARQFVRRLVRRINNRAEFKCAGRARKKRGPPCIKSRLIVALLRANNGERRARAARAKARVATPLRRRLSECGFPAFRSQGSQLCGRPHLADFSATRASRRLSG